MFYFRLILDLWFWSYEYSTIDFEDFIIKSEPSPSNGSLPSFDVLNESLKGPTPPKIIYSDGPVDGDLFQRLEKQLDSPSIMAQDYNSPKWAEDKVLNLSLRKRAIELAEQSGKIGKNGYHIKELASGRFAGEKAVYFNSNTVRLGRLLSLINPKKSIG